MTNQTGEYCKSLYYVILISLSLSWLTAVTTTPLITKKFILSKKDRETSGEKQDVYGGKFYTVYRKLLSGAIKARWVTIIIVLAMFVASLVGFGFIQQLFSSYPQPHSSR